LFFKKCREEIADLDAGVRVAANNAEMQVHPGRIYLLKGNRQTAPENNEKVAALDARLAKQFYGLIYSDLLISAAEK
jgi:hypothetical protein